MLTVKCILESFELTEAKPVLFREFRGQKIRCISHCNEEAQTKFAIFMYVMYRIGLGKANLDYSIVLILRWLELGAPCSRGRRSVKMKKSD